MSGLKENRLRRKLESNITTRNLAIFLFGAIIVAIAVTFSVRDRTLQRELLMSDPDSVMARPAISSFALSRGRGLFSSHCSACHGAEGKGDPSTGVPDLTDSDYLYGQGRVSEIEDIVRHGIRAGDRRGRNFAYMPTFASAKPYDAEPIPPLTPADVHDVVQDLLALAGRPADGLAASRGGAIYLGRGGCYDCHGGDAKGDPAIGAPNLTDRIWLFGDGSERSIADSIEHGRKGYSPAYGGKLSAAEIREVAVYAASLSASTTGEGGAP